MKRSLIRVGALLLSLMMLMTAAAFAEVSRGDRGVEVYDLQQLLFETGWLFESPDGIFGGRTEEAVKGFEEYAKLPVDGIADDQMIYELCVSLEALNEELGIVSDYFGAYPTEYYSADSYEEDDAVEQSGGREPVVLNGSVIIDGDTIYYSGNIAGEGEGIYAMNSDGSNRRMLADIQAVLLAASNGNLLVWRYDDASGMMGIVRTDGIFETVFYSYCHAIAHNGRFYFGGSSIVEDGADHQWMLSSDPEKHDNYYPIEVADGYLYYLDANGSGMIAYDESGRLPGGDVELNRLNLKTGEIELLSGIGTNYLDIDDGMMYYTREDFIVYDFESGGSFEADVDDGLYSMNLESLGETMIAEIPESDLVFEYYMVHQDDVVYGEHSDFTDDEAVYKIVRRHVGGDELPAIETGENDVMILCVKDGVLYGLQGILSEEDEYYSYEEYIVAYDLQTGEMSMFAMDENEVMAYTEARPRIAVENGRIYYCVQSETDGAESLKSMALDGSDVRTLIQGAPLY